MELARVAAAMGFVFQDFRLIPGLPAWENITYPLIPRGVRRGAPPSWPEVAGPAGPGREDWSAAGES